MCTAVKLSTTVFFIPVIVSLARVYSCGSATGSMWLTTGIACFGSVHVVVIVAATLLLIAYATMTLIGMTLILHQLLQRVFLAGSTFRRFGEGGRSRSEAVVNRVVTVVNSNHTHKGLTVTRPLYRCLADAVAQPCSILIRTLHEYVELRFTDERACVEVSGKPTFVSCLGVLFLVWCAVVRVRRGAA